MLKRGFLPSGYAEKPSPRPPGPAKTSITGMRETACLVILGPFYRNATGRPDANLSHITIGRRETRRAPPKTKTILLHHDAKRSGFRRTRKTGGTNRAATAAVVALAATGAEASLATPCRRGDRRPRPRGRRKRRHAASVPSINRRGPAPRGIRDLDTDGLPLVILSSGVQEGRPV